MLLLLGLLSALNPVNGARIELQSTQIKLLWDANAPADNVTKYVVSYHLATSPEVFSDAGLNLEFIYPTLPPGTYFFKVYAENASGRSPGSLEVSTTVTPPVDTTPPSSPTNVIGSGSSMFQINLSWNAATDNVGVVAYDVFRNSIKVGSSVTTTFTDSGLTLATTYSYTIQARDAVGNLSLESNPVLVSTLGDTTGPTQPSGLQGVPTTTTVALTWGVSTDNIGVVGYKISRNGTQILVTSSLTYTDASLAPNTPYSYSVIAFDAAGNNSTPAAVTIQTLALPAPCVLNGKPYTITIAIQSYSKQVSISAPGGPVGRVDLSFQNSFPVTLVQIKLGAQVVGEVPATDLRDMLAIRFTTPRVIGVYNLFVTARDSTGCITSTTLVRPVTVVP